MNTSQEGIDLIKSFEGFRSAPYICPAGVATYGYGTTAGVTMNTPPITEDEAEALLARDLLRFERSVSRLCPVSLTQGQFDALVSFSYNLGSGALQSSTLRRRLLRGDYEGAADELLRWVWAGGRRLAGLVRRRAAERVLFIREGQ